MSSTHFNVGLTSEKNSSRVLRPPGGGHSDIFGVRENELITPSKNRRYPQSMIGSCFSMVDDPKEQTQPKGDGSTTNGEEKRHDIDDEINENKRDETKEEQIDSATRGACLPSDGSLVQGTNVTNFNIGATSEINSRRALRPPGGRSNIFDVRDNGNELITPSKKRNPSQSTIGSCFSMVDEPRNQTKPKENKTATNGEDLIKEERINEIGTQPEKEQKQINPAAKRACVPPGGFSLGLW